MIKLLHNVYIDQLNFTTNSFFASWLPTLLLILHQVRKQRRKDQNESDHMEIRVRKLKQISPRVQRSASNPIPQQVQQV